MGDKSFFSIISKQSKMFSTGIRILLLVFVGSVQNISICNDETKNQVIVIALLNFHDEASNCTKVSLRGIQQQFILEKTTYEINKETDNDGMHLYLNIVDSCSVIDQGLNAVSKSLVSSNQTCRNPPLLLGFIGPENLRQLYAVQQITSVFNKFHMLPFPPDVRMNLSDSSILYVGNSRNGIRSKIMLAILNQLGWKSVYVVMGENVATPGMLEYLLKEINHLCITGMSKIPENMPKINTFYSSIIQEYQSTGAEGIVIIAEEPGNIRPLLEIMKNYSTPRDSPNPPIVIYMIRVGLKSWELPLNFSILFLQETSGDVDEHMMESLHLNPLMNTYYEQYELDYKRDAFADLLDPTVLPLKYALNLYWNAMKYAKNIKCKLGISDSSNTLCSEIFKTTSSEWKTFLYKSSYNDITIMRKISLQMKVPLNVKIYLTDAIVNTPQLIGSMTEIGITDLQINLAKNFPKGNKGFPKRCLSSSVIPNKTIRDDLDPPEVVPKSWFGWILRYWSYLLSSDESVLNGTGYFNMILLWLVIIIAFFICLFLVTLCVYKVFKVESSENYERKKQKGIRCSRRSS